MSPSTLYAVFKDGELLETFTSFHRAAAFIVDAIDYGAPDADVEEARFTVGEYLLGGERPVRLR